MLDLPKLKEEYQNLTNQLIDPEVISQWEKFQTISKRRSALEKILKKAEELEDIQRRIEENNQILASPEDSELASMAQQELLDLKHKEQALSKELERLTSGGEDMPDSVIMEIRSGAGGGEASLFASNLWNMYNKYAASKGWSVTILNTSETEVGGIRDISFQVDGEGAFSALQYEGGVHRVQRIPETEKAGRIHTSTVSVAVLPKPKETQIIINPADIQLEFTGSSGPGGQNVNKRQTAVRLIHLPTNIVIECQTSRNQQKNREFAMSLLQAKLYEMQEQAKESELSAKRKAQIGWAKRAEKIRTYNFPQDRVTDHRLPETWHGIERILGGDLDEIASALDQFQKSSETAPNPSLPKS